MADKKGLVLGHPQGLSLETQVGRAEVGKGQEKHALAVKASPWEFGSLLLMFYRLKQVL